MAAPQPINERFTEEQYSRSITKPIARNVVVERFSSTGTNTARTASKKAGGIAIQATGVTMQAAGKSAKVVGTGATRAGAALSATGVGAIVGVPLAAAGVATRAAGTGVDAAGRITRRIGKAAGKTRQSKKVPLKPKAMSMSGMMEKMLLFNFTAFWFGVMVPAVLVSLFSAGIADSLDKVANKVEETAASTVAMNPLLNAVVTSAVVADIATEGALSDGAEAAVESTGSFIKKTTGIDVGVFFDALDPMTWFGSLHSLVMILGIGMMLIVAMYYAMDGKAVLSGRGMLMKKALFLGGIIGYAMPVLNLIPWFLFYALVIKKYPD